MRMWKVLGVVGYPYGLVAYNRVEAGETTARVRAYENARGKRFERDGVPQVLPAYETEPTVVEDFVPMADLARRTA